MKFSNAKAALIFLIRLKSLPAKMDFDSLHPTDNIEKHGNTKYSLSDSPAYPSVRI